MSVTAITSDLLEEKIYGKYEFSDVAELQKHWGMDWEPYTQPLDKVTASDANLDMSSYCVVGRGPRPSCENEQKLWKANSFKKKPFGIFKGYKVIDNQSLFQSALEIAKISEGRLKISSAGTFSNDSKQFIELSGSRHSLRGGDDIQFYYLLTNSHDGTLAFSGRPMSYRFVCQNQLRGIIGKNPACFKLYHSRFSASEGNRKKELELAVSHFLRSINDSKQQMEKLTNSSDVNDKLLTLYLIENYYRDIRKPETPLQEERMYQAITDMQDTFRHESRMFGRSVWVAYNAYTKWLQHNAGHTNQTSERRHYRNILGTGIEGSAAAFKSADKLLRNLNVAA